MTGMGISGRSKKRTMKKRVRNILCFGALLVGLTGCSSTYGQDVEQLRNYAIEQEKELPIKQASLHGEDGVQPFFRVDGKYFQVYQNGSFESLYVKGVNIGLGKPGAFPGEAAITKEEYARWFQEIGEMNANCVRVYTVQSPSFYQAFYEYNMRSNTPLYLFQGTWYDEARIAKTQDVYDEELQEKLYQDMRNLVDIIHGNCTVEPRTGEAFGTYKWDISPYVIGWILGIESDAELVSSTNELHQDHTSYEGTYICTKDASPFETFWAETGDFITAYEMEHYQLQRPVSFSNWPTADKLEHPSETRAEEALVTLDMNHLQATDAFVSGLFASWHIYPSYPNFMYTQADYREKKGRDGRTNTYLAYLEDLMSQYDMPMLVAEFGVPASRGAAHANPYTGFDQGNHSEQEQGEMLVSMMQDIYDTGYAGGLIFAWQDEWFKSTWNTEKYTDSDRRPFWKDVMTNEQQYGLLEFVPGNGKDTVILDGKTKEWGSDDILSQNENVALSVKSDAAYLYLLIQALGEDFDHTKILLPIDVTPVSGSKVYDDITLERPVDFVLEMQGKEQSHLVVQNYYDTYQFAYWKYDESVKELPERGVKESQIFRPVNYLLERELILPDREEVFPVHKVDFGQLTFGTNDYDAENYNSIADFYYENGVMEIRIPWLLLNFRDPSTKEIEDDFWVKGDFEGRKIDGIWIGLREVGGQRLAMQKYTWYNWDTPTYFERLRKSYYIVQKQFEELEVLPEDKGES